MERAVRLRRFRNNPMSQLSLSRRARESVIKVEQPAPASDSEEISLINRTSIGLAGITIGLFGLSIGLGTAFEAPLTLSPSEAREAVFTGLAFATAGLVVGCGGAALIRSRQLASF